MKFNFIPILFGISSLKHQSRSTVLRGMQILAIILGLVHISDAQVSENSPLSSLGIGELTEPGTVAGNSLSGLFATYYNGYNVNLVNPASYAGLAATAFDVGVDASYITLDDNTSSQSAWGGNLKYLSLSFPLVSPVNIVLDRKEQLFKMGMNIALLPVSKMDYRINQKTQLTDGSQVTRQYGGNGGLNKLQFGTGAQYRNFSAGFNIGFLFGTIDNEKSLLFEELPNGHHTYNVNERAYSGLLWDAGLLYRHYLTKNLENPSKNRWISIGVYGNSKQPVKVDQQILTLRKANGYTGLDDADPNRTTLDTISQHRDEGLRNHLPSQIGFGVSYSMANRLQAGVNMSFDNWESFNNLLNIGDLRNSWSAAASVEYTPNPNSLLNYWNRVSYRSSVYVTKDPRVIAGDDGLDEKGVQIGLGLPIFQKRQLSYINFSIDYGKLAGQTFSEKFVRFNIGVTLNNNLWFYKRRFE
ncbi:hypothetical protein KUV50_08890 [Membranicola marinus]|uniref:Long-chain fatty acid transport protein n=1 Tax=Membranihabitans marinus TaxID=1227546 RepID=A0A953LCX5_9BACT|nr:hypothetical protein [Membranihabitans marinus]MBY5958244.1 hypothetical protein [Membranihabitans marinus]